MNFAIVNQLVGRAFCWIFLFSAGVVEINFVNAAQHDASYFFAIIAWAIAQFFMVQFLGKNSLFYDIRELCLYEILFATIALVAYESSITSNLYTPLAYAINFMKYGRLIWPCRSRDKNYFTAWPVFGILGYIAKKRQQRPAETDATHQQALFAYLYIVFSFALAFLMFHWQFTLKMWQFSIAPLILIPLIYPHIIANLQEYYRRLVEHERAANEVQNALHHAAEIEQRELERKQLIAALQEKDLTNQRLLHELRQYNAAIRDANHDLAQPQMYVDACAYRLVRAKDEQSRAAASHALLMAVAQMGGCVQDAIHSAKIATQIEAPRCEAVNLNELFTDLCEAWSDKAFEKGVSYFDCHPQGACQIVVATDQAILLRILRNLVVNAILYVPAGGSILLAVRKRREHCLLQVWDSGPGLEMAQGRDGVANFVAFAAWVRHARQQRQHSGHGLGTNNIQQLCTALGTQMEVHSRLGIGTRFSFRLPIASAELIAQTALARAAQRDADYAAYSEYE